MSSALKISHAPLFHRAQNLRVCMTLVRDTVLVWVPLKQTLSPDFGDRQFNWVVRRAESNVDILTPRTPARDLIGNSVGTEVISEGEVLTGGTDPV